MVRSVTLLGLPGGPSLDDRTGDMTADGIDWRDVTRGLVATRGEQVSIQRLVRDDEGEPVDLEILMFLGDDRVDEGRVTGMRVSELSVDWDPHRELEAVRAALGSGSPARQTVTVATPEPQAYLIELDPIGGDLLVVSYSALEPDEAVAMQLREPPIELPPPQRPDELRLVANRRGRIIHLSPTVGELLGRSTPELVAHGLTGVIEPEVAVELIEATCRIAAAPPNTPPERFDLALRHADGSDVHTRWTVRPAPGVGVLATGIDVTNDIEQERHLRSILDAVESPVVLLDDRNSLFVNRAWTRFTGRDPDTADGALDDWHPDDRAALIDAAERARITGAQSTVEARLRRRDGEWRWMMDTVAPVERDEGVLMVALAVDVHDHRHDRERLRELTDLAPDIVFRFRLQPDFGVEYVSPAFERITGYAVEEHHANPYLQFEIVHPDDRHLLQSVARGERDDIVVRARHRDGHWLWLEIRVHHARDDQGRVVMTSGISRDVTRVKEVEVDLAHRATHDALTDLPNRALLADLLERQLARWRRTRAGALALVFVDLDRFKLVNDTHGHDVGDSFLREVAGRLRNAVRESDTVARLGGDEFAVLVDAESAEEAVAIAERVLHSLDDHLEAGGYELFASASAGLAFAGDNARTAGDLLRHADTALARAKERGRSRLELFDDHLRAELERRHQLEQQLRAAVDAGEITTEYQPIVDLLTGRVVAVEVLARWIDRDGVTIPPNAFIPLAEETGAVSALGAHVLRSSLATLAGWHAEGHSIDLSVNLSARQLADDDIVDLVLGALEDADVDAGHLCVEVTETVLVSDSGGAAARLGALRERGIRVAVDDFGTGFSSLSYLDRLPIDLLKIDRSFVTRLGDSTPDLRGAAIARSIIEMAGALGLDAYAEGVETAAQWSSLIDLGCIRGQGYLFARPMTATEVTPILSHRLAPTER
jgi:diguanylate cyclase (GGDEF)-like protein/PAS domain S-box-containing protein